MKKVIGGVLGAVAGTFLLGTGGYLYGLLFVAWFGHVSSVGLEGLLPPIIGSVTGATLGGTVGAMTGILIARRSPLKLVRLVVFLIAGVAACWLLSLFVGPFDIERLPGPILVFSVSLYIPVIAWIAIAWDKPETSI